jgi:tRNA1(Val) A37 N6-methylase TrmN6
VHRRPRTPTRYLDLGCGIGSVMLMVCHRLRPERARGVEAQPQSVEMARRAVAELPEYGEAIELMHSDFRELEDDPEGFELITGSPPYFPLSDGVLPADPQRRACRFEARGGVEAYLETAARMLRPEGRFYLVFQTRWDERVLAAARDADLQLTGRADFQMRRDRPDPFLTVYEFAREAAASVHRFTCPVREADGAISPEYLRIRSELGVD